MDPDTLLAGFSMCWCGSRYVYNMNIDLRVVITRLSLIINLYVSIFPLFAAQPHTYLFFWPTMGFLKCMTEPFH